MNAFERFQLKSHTIAACFLVLPTMCVPNLLNAQDTHFSQFNETSLQLNPASAGVNNDVNVVLNYKDQWQNTGEGFRTFALSSDLRLLKASKNHLGLGINFMNDQAGVAKMTTTQGNISLAGIIHLDKMNVFSTGIMLGFSQRTIQPENLKFGNQYDGVAFNSSLPSGEANTPLNVNFLDAGAGIYYSYGAGNNNNSFMNDTKKVNVGLSVFHPNNPKISFYGENSEKLNMKIVFQGDGSFGIKNTNLNIQPSFLFMAQGTMKEIIVGSALQYKLKDASRVTGFKKSSALSFGTYLRWKDAFIGLIKYDFANYSIGLSYDVNISKLYRATNFRGGFELSLRFRSPGIFGKTINRSRI